METSAVRSVDARVHERVGKIAIIGAGRAGSALARAFETAGLDVVAVSGSTSASESARSLAESVGAEHVATAPEVVRMATTILIAVPDSRIRSVADEVSEGIAAEISGALESGGQLRIAVGHTSGATTLEALDPVATNGGRVFSFHPVLPLSGRPEDGELLRGAPVALAGIGEGRDVAEALAEAVGARPFSVDEKSRALYHAACALASNALVGMIDASLTMALASGVENPADVFLELAAATVDNLEQKPPREALTGPIARGDVATVEAHLAAIDRDLPALGDYYRSVCRRLLDVADLDDSLRGEFEAVLRPPSVTRVVPEDEESRLPPLGLPCETFRVDIEGGGD